MGLNRTASFLWCAADGVLSVEALALRLTQVFAVPMERARSDAADFFGMMAQRGLVQLAVPAPETAP